MNRPQPERPTTGTSPDTQTRDIWAADPHLARRLHRGA